MIYGKLYLIPNLLSTASDNLFIPPLNKQLVHHIRHFIVENPKPARTLLKQLGIAHSFDEIRFWQLNEHTQPDAINKLLEALENNDCGLITDAGIPCVADPGWQVVALAHQKNIQVIPLPGASSIFMALMASGLNGQQFCFNGYLPIDKQDRVKKIKHLQQILVQTGQTQIFMETPYRNNQLLQDLIKTCLPHVKLCVAAGISGEKEWIKTQTISEWSRAQVNIHKIPAIFILGL